MMLPDLAFGFALCELAGIDPHECTSYSIVRRPQNPVETIVDFTTVDVELDELVETLKRFKLVPIEGVT